MNGRTLPPLNALRAFEAAARLGSLSRAAAELHVTHGAISRHVRSLEEALGAPLFEREGRGLALTRQGERLRDASGEAFNALQAAWTGLQRDLRPSALVLGCPGSVLARWAIPRLERLALDLPALKLHLSAQEGGFDAALWSQVAELGACGLHLPEVHGGLGLGVGRRADAFQERF